MRKIGIITLYGYTNYGNRFQNYAVQEIVKKYGFSAETIVVYPNCKQIVKTVIYKILSVFGNTNAKRYMKFYRFSRNYIPIRIIINKNMRISKKTSKKYDFFVAGSDQVWNPFIRNKERDNLFLRFARKDQRLCISPSFGVSELEERFREDFINGLNGFKYLSAREQSGVDIIYSLTGRKAELLIDPTLALSSAQWNRIAIQGKRSNKDYILVAMLGKTTDEHNNYINNIAALNGLSVINVFDKGAIYGPDEVLGLISGATLIFTDSFHFTAFSINYNIPFVVSIRVDDTIDHEMCSSMFSRIASLLTLFHLEERTFDNMKQCKDAFKCNFEVSNLILVKEREKLFSYIERGLNS